MADGVPRTRTWVSPEGSLFDIADEQLYAFCTSRGLHCPNMIEHMDNVGSKQKNGGWRLLERLCFISHVDRCRGGRRTTLC